MKHLRNNTRMAGILSLLLLFCVSLSAQNEKPFVIPELKEWNGGKGTFQLNEHSAIVYEHPDLTEVARLFAEDYSRMFGVTLPTRAGKPAAGDILLSLKKNKMKMWGPEGYTIRIGKSVEVAAATPTGAYWATRTLLQMSEQSEVRSLPVGNIFDYPDYDVRGFMMDCGRKFIPMEYLRDLARILSYYKMNTLQIHLNDNGFKKFFGEDWDKTYAAFRLECETFPGLTARDGFYTKSEFLDFQKQAAARFVEIIPEIDAPAHTLAFSHYNPALGSKEYGMDHLDLFNPETYTFMDALFKEYLSGENPVFYGPKVHIGTDEYSNKKQDVVEKFREFTDRYIRLVESYGKQACVWGALTHAKGSTPVKAENVIMSAWYNGYADPKEMVKQGYKLISIPDGWLYIVPAAGYYYDYLNTEKLYKEWTPAHVGKEVFPEKDPAILGGMFAVWNDHVGNGISVKDIHHRLFPALQTLAVKMWNPTAVSVPYSDFDKCRMQLSEAPGVNQLGRIGKAPATVYTAEVVRPGMTLPYPEIGYDYTVSFEVDAVAEVPGTELFRSAHAVFYLSDPISGKIGFARDGYLNTFNYQFYSGEKASVKIVGDNTSTSLTVNGKLVETLGREKCYRAPEATMNYMPTLCFPLEKAGNFKSSITNLRVDNHK